MQHYDFDKPGWLKLDQEPLALTYIKLSDIACTRLIPPFLPGGRVGVAIGLRSGQEIFTFFGNGLEAAKTFIEQIMARVV